MAAAPVQVTVLYPSKSDATFKMDYYLETHMPLVKKELDSFGFKGYSVLKMAPGPDGKDGPFIVQATLHFDNVENFQKGMGEKGSVVRYVSSVRCVSAAS